MATTSIARLASAYDDDLYRELESVQIHIEWVSRDTRDQELIVQREEEKLQDKYYELNGLIADFNNIQALIREKNSHDDRQE